MSGAPREAGALVALLDQAMRTAARERAGGAEVAVVDLHVAFLQDDGGPVTTVGRVCGGGRSVCFCEAEAADASGRIVARAMGTFRQRPR